MAYLTFNDYYIMGGKLEDEEVFEDLEFAAEALIDNVTFGRLKNDTPVCEEVKRLTFFLINIAVSKANALSLGKGETENLSGAFIKNQSNDGVSVSYSSMNAADLYNVCNKEANRTILRYLHGVKNQAGRLVLYRGLYPGE